MSKSRNRTKHAGAKTSYSGPNGRLCMRLCIVTIKSTDSFRNFSFVRSTNISVCRNGIFIQWVNGVANENFSLSLIAYALTILLDVSCLYPPLHMKTQGCASNRQISCVGSCVQRKRIKIEIFGKKTENIVHGSQSSVFDQTLQMLVLHEELYSSLSHREATVSVRNW